MTVSDQLCCVSMSAFITEVKLLAVPPPPPSPEKPEKEVPPVPDCLLLVRPNLLATFRTVSTWPWRRMFLLR
jgi:hypothetical protein